MRIWDMHCHLVGQTGSPRERVKRLITVGQRHGIERLCVHMGLKFNHDPSAEEMVRQNDQVLEGISGEEERVYGMVYLSPKHIEASLAEIERCVVRGPMVGIKLWTAVRASEARLDPIIRRATELGLLVIQHTWLKVGGSPRIPGGANLPGESTPQDLAHLALRHPDASFICIHAGGDWEIGIRSVRDCPNVTVEIAGGDSTTGMVEMAVREVGAERVVFGSDAPGRSFASQLAKVYGAELPPAQQEKILGGNIRRLLAGRIGSHA